MIAFRTFVVFSSVLLLVQSAPQQINLISKLPEKPIEDPAEWAWGEHPKDGFGFKARNSLTLEQCLASPLLAGTPVCEGNVFPKEFCLENRLVTADGCKQFLGDICTLSIDLAESLACAGAADEITFLQCVSDGAVCRAKICDKKIPNKEFCPAL